MCTDFNIVVSELFPASASDFALAPFQECTVAIGGDPVLTGYIDSYLPEVEADRYAVRITGRSRTEDISIARLTSKAGYKLDPSARANASLFKIDVVVQTDFGKLFPGRRLSGTKLALPSSSSWPDCVPS